MKHARARRKSCRIVVHGKPQEPKCCCPWLFPKPWPAIGALLVQRARCSSVVFGSGECHDWAQVCHDWAQAELVCCHARRLGMVSQFLEQSIPVDNVPCLPAFQLTEQRLCGGHVVSASLQHCDLLPSSASVQENCAVGLGASARARPGSKSSNCRRRYRPQSGDDFRSDASQVPPLWV
jgi:hypothetical protein